MADTSFISPVISPASTVPPARKVGEVLFIGPYSDGGFCRVVAESFNVWAYTSENYVKNDN